MPSTIPSGGITLHNAAESTDASKSGTSSAILFKLDDSVLRDLKGAPKDDLRFVTGSVPKLRIGGRTIDLSISPDAFRNELFASTTSASSNDFTFTSIISHRAELKSANRNGAGETAGSDAALAALQSSLASYKQEKEANQANISDGILDIPKNRADAMKKEKLARKQRLLNNRNGSQAGSPSLSAIGTPRLGAGPTSVPLSEDEVRLQAMRKPLVHLLAIGPTTSDEIRSKTHIPKEDLDIVLRKVGKQGDGGRWQLTDKACKELDIWSFGYPAKDDRDSAIENAIKSYDRLRLDQDDKLWQMLLPKEERGKGKTLSRLHLNGGVSQVQRSLTPHYQPSPAHGEALESKAASTANTPRLGASTPRPSSSKGTVMSRLLSKDPQKAKRMEEAKEKKARATEEAKDKKRKEREATASDKEGGKSAKRQATKKTNPNVKSAEIVHSSDDDSAEEGEVRVKPKPASVPRSQPAAKQAIAGTSTSPESSDVAKPAREVKKPTAKVKASQTTAKATASPAVKAAKASTATAGKNTPQTANGLSAPTSQQKSNRSPSAVSSRPGVPSPLSAARPRVASDVSDRNAVGVQRVRQGADTPRGLGITNGTRKRQDTVTNGREAAPNGKAVVEERTADRKINHPTNGSAVVTVKTNGVAPKNEAGTKRKSDDSTADMQQPHKHRKTESTSSQSQLSQTTSLTSNNTAQTSPDAGATSSSDNSSAVLENITYKMGVNRAQEFKDKYYPAYVKLYDEIEAKQARGEQPSREQVGMLRKQHQRLLEMKREIEVASRREAGEV